MAAGSRAADYAKIPLVEHMAQSNREILLACMIEDMEAVERIDEIAAVEGVDLLAVGPSDLSRSLGVSGQPGHPRLMAAIARGRARWRHSRPIYRASPVAGSSSNRRSPNACGASKSNMFDNDPASSSN